MANDTPDWSQGVVNAPSSPLLGTRINPSTTVVTDAAAGSKKVYVADNTIFTLADTFMVTSSPGPAQQTFGGFVVTGVGSDGGGEFIQCDVTPMASDTPPGSVITVIGQVGIIFNDRVSVQVTAPPTGGPAPWQAPQNRIHVDQSNGNFPVTLVTGVAGKIIYVHGWELEIDLAAAARFARLYDSVAGPGTGDFATVIEQAGPGLTGSGGGGPLSAGAGIVLSSTALNTEFVRVTVWYSGPV